MKIDRLIGILTLLNAATRDRRIVAFHYYCSTGEEDKRVEPYRLVFKWSHWYLFGFCSQRQDFRLYKLRRLWQLELTQEDFFPRPAPEEKKQLGSHFADATT